VRLGTREADPRLLRAIDPDEASELICMPTTVGTKVETVLQQVF